MAAALNPKVPAVVSVFAGRIADTGVDPVPHHGREQKDSEGLPQAELLWASVREVLNIFQANDCGCHIVTVPHDILGKAMKMAGMDLAELSLDTVKMFANDAKAAGFSLVMRAPGPRPRPTPAVNFIRDRSESQISFVTVAKTSQLSPTPCTRAIPRACP